MCYTTWVGVSDVISGLLPHEMEIFLKKLIFHLYGGVSVLLKNDLEKPEFHVVIIDVLDSKKSRVISLYRSFRPQGGVSTEIFFAAQNKKLSCDG